MLRRLLIRDFVIVDALELELRAGFGALTGETGAGKSILVDALSMALGERADAAVVRSGCGRAEIGAEFFLEAGSEPAQWIEANDLSAGRECLLRRVVEASGRSRAYINGSAVTLAQLRELGARLVDIHGQHAHHALLHAETQRALLDAHGDLTGLAEQTSRLYRAWRRLAEARSDAERDVAAQAREADMLEWQLSELRQLAFDREQWPETIREQRRLAHAASLTEAAVEALASLDEGEAAAGPQVARIAARLRSLAELDADLLATAELLEAAGIQLAEAVHSMRRYRDRVEADPGRLTELDQRLDAVHQLARKHKVSPEELPDVQCRIEERLDQLRALADPVALAAREQAALAAYRQAAAALSGGRARAAAALADRVTEAMQALAMKGGRLTVQLRPTEEPASYGLETVEFHVAASPSQTLRPLSRVASGGELSRIGLAIQVISSTAGQAGTLVFDEVDVGIGGRVAEIVGRMLREVGRRSQVLCVTHLPQVAAQADWQWSVAKEEVAGGVASQVRPLEGEERVEEIARMLGGATITSRTRAHAREMLGMAAQAQLST
jgi:DNA repair protein RecN (Recombination protein N)